jgi:hypothetical protein
MKNMFKYAAFAALAAVTLPHAAQAAPAAAPEGQSALVEALVKKGVLSQQEADQIISDMAKDEQSSSASKLQISSFIEKLRLYGDARLRYQYQNARTNGDYSTNSQEDRNRYRYRLRLGAEYIYDENWSAGVRLETATANNSSNVDFGRYFDKFGDSVNVGLAYLEYRNKFSLFDSPGVAGDDKNPGVAADPGVTIGTDARFGKHEKQILLSEAFWDPDTNPEGISEEVTVSNVGIDGLSLAARGGGYIISAPTTNSFDVAPSANDTAGLFVGQIEGKYAWAPNSNVRIAPLYLVETNGNFGAPATAGTQEVSSASSIGIAPTQALTGTNPAYATGRMEVVAVPIEINWKLWNLPNKVWGTYGANLDGNDRLAHMGFAAGDHGQNSFWNAGYQLGQNKVKGDWSTSLEWRWIESASYTTNLSESDWANNGLNQQGFVLRAGYNFTDFVIGQVSYYHSNPIQGGVLNTPSQAASVYYPTGASNPFQGEVDIVQVDLSWKF